MMDIKKAKIEEKFLAPSRDMHPPGSPATMDRPSLLLSTRSIPASLICVPWR